MGLGQAHRRQPLAADDLAEVTLPCSSGDGMRVQALVGAVQQAGVHRPGVVGRGEHLVQRGVEHLRQALAADLRVAGERRPAGRRRRPGRPRGSPRGVRTSPSRQRAAFEVAAAR